MLRVLYVPHDPEATDERAAWRWLETAQGITARRAEPDGLVEALEFGPDVIWIHATSAGAGRDPALAELRDRVGERGLLLTGGAAVLPITLRLEHEPPNEIGRRAWPEGEDAAEEHPVRGHAAFRSHPLFEGLGTAVSTWRPRPGDEYTTVTYRHPAWPMRGRVIAVERTATGLNADRATVWEYDTAEDSDTRVLCIGTHLPFTTTDPRTRPLLNRLLHNALHYAAGRPPAGDDRRAGVWRRRPPRTVEDRTLPAPELPGLSEPLPALDVEPVLQGDADGDGPFTLAGRRALAAGGEARGVDEVWVHPLRIARALRVEHAETRDVTVTPAGVERRLAVEGRLVTERIFVPRNVPGVIVEWRAEDGDAGDPPRIAVSWQTELRLAPPYPAGVLGTLHWRRADRSLLVRTDEPDDAALFLLSRAPERWDVEDASGSDAPALACRAVVSLEGGEGVRLAMLATTEGERVLEQALRTLRRPPSLVRARSGALRTLARRTLRAATEDDERVGAALRWAVYRLDSFRVDSPGAGQCLMAGYAAAHDGGDAGAPRYSGRDAAWTALASLAAGDDEPAREVLRFLGEHQEPSGRILDEMSTSGVARFGAADTTPLYLLLMARYAAWTGDLGFVAEQWKRVHRAFEFCVAADDDDDGLVEGLRPGSDWIEAGPLAGGTVSVYTAGIWAAALAELAVTAEALGDQAFAFVLRRRSEQARTALDAVFYDADERSYALDVRQAEGAPAAGWIRTPTQTALQAMPLLLDTMDPGRAEGWLDAVATDEFTAPWGVRLLPRSAAGYDPAAPYAGSVWPLLTGWVSWAEYAAGRSRAAFRHWRTNAEQAFRRARGAWDQVLDGEEERAAGGAPDHAAAAGVVVASFVHGLLGAEPDAPRHRLRLRPQIPEGWNRLDVDGITVGDARVSLHYRREGDRHTFRLDQESGPVPLRVVFEPLLPAHRLLDARVDEQDATLDPRPFGERLLVPLQVVLDFERTIEFRVEDTDD